MRPCYLFGPVSQAFAEENLHGPRQAGECLAFNATGDIDLAVRHNDAWETVRARFPSGWRPDFIALYLPYTSIPACLWSATNPSADSMPGSAIPIVGLAADWNLLWHHYRRQLCRCDLVLTDTAGVEVMSSEGITHARQAILYGCGKDFLEKSEPRVPPWLLKEPGRDIDALFVGNLHPAVQRERLPWLARLARLSERWKVEIHTRVFGNDYRNLLRRARIVFNRGIRGEANRRVFEVVAAGALLFQEDGNLEVPICFRDRQECVYYNENNLEELLHYYLDHEDQRKTIAEAARARLGEFTFESFWEKHLALIQSEWLAITERARQRLAEPAANHSPLTTNELLGRSWEALGGPLDPALARDLAVALAEEPHHTALHNALGLVTAMAEKGGGPTTAQVAHKAIGYFRRALENDPGNVMARLNLAESLVTLDQKAEAGEQAGQALKVLANGQEEVARDGYPFAPEDKKSGKWSMTSESGHFPLGFDMFRVEWERAAWAHAGQPAAEAQAKRDLIRWRLHLLLGDLTGDLNHFYEAVLARPDLSPTRAALGCALARAGRFSEALEHLHHAVRANPFDLDAVHGLFQAYGAAEQGMDQRRLARQRRQLAKACPQLVPAEEWFVKIPPVGDELVSIIILGCNELEYTRTCLQSVVRHTRTPYELILVDNGSTDGTREYLEEFRSLRNGESRNGDRTFDLASSIAGSAAYCNPLFSILDPQPMRIEVIRNEKNLGYAAGCNQGMARAQGRYVVFLNNDTLVTECWLEGLIAWALHDWPSVGMVGAVTNYASPPQLIPVDYREPAGVEAFAARRRRDFTSKAMKVGRLAGFCLLVRREVLDQVGGMDEQYELGFFEDDDLCARVEQAGFQLLLALDVFIHHFGSRTFQSLGVDCQEQLRLNYEKFKAKWGPERAAGYRLPAPAFSEPLPNPVVHQEATPSAHLPVAVQESETGDGGLRRRLGTISLCMMVKNEEENLPGCLTSAAGLFDEIVVVDTGSTDHTKEIAAGFGARVVDFAWVDSFAAARNEGLRHAAGEWIFWLDADDRLDEENRRKLKDLIEDLRARNGETNAFISQQPSAYSMKCLCLGSRGGPSLTNGRTGGSATIVDHVRLFRNHSQLRWQYRVHEQILPGVRRLGGLVRPADVVIHHVGYQDLALRLRKQQRDLRLLQLDNAEHPEDPFILFNLGWAYSESKKPAEALPCLRKSLERSQPADSIVRKLFTLIVQCHRQLGQLTEALQACQTGQKYYPQDIELLFNESLIRRAQGDLAGAETCLIRLLQSREDPHFASVEVGLNTFIARHNLAAIHQEQGRLAEAEAQWRMAVKEQPSYAPAWVGLAGLHLTRQEFGEIASIISKLESLQPQCVWSLFLRAQTHLARQEHPAARSALEKAISLSPQEVVLWILLSHTLLKEGKDWLAAEQALRKILELDPNNAEARGNLAILLQKLGRPIAESNHSPVDLAELYRRACNHPSDVNEHCPTLHSLALECRHVTELGTRTGVSTTAFLFAQPEKLVCYDLLKFPQVDQLQAVAGQTKFVFHEADVLKVGIENTDLLFIDTLHDYEQLRQELSLHAGKVKKYVVLHDTTTFGERGETPGHRGLWPAVEEFLTLRTFRLKQRFENNHGLTILERAEAPEQLL